MTRPCDRSPLDELAEAYGICLDYWDIWGGRHPVGDETKRAILAAMGVRADTEDDIDRELATRRDRPWREACDPALVVRTDSTGGSWSFRLPADEGEDARVRIRWEVRDESGRLRHRAEAGPGLDPAEARHLEGRRYARVALPLPTGLDPGYYDLSAYAVTPSRFVEGTLRLIIVPPACFVPPVFREGRGTWGLSLQLYGLRSSRNWGAGDFGDLAEVVDWAVKDLRCGIIGVNPLHALRNTRPYHVSPYSPDSRLYLNLLYLDVERVPEYQESAEAQRLVQDEAFKARLDEIRQSDRVSYDQVAETKRAVLEACFATFEDRHLGHEAGGSARPPTERGRAFERYLRDEGEALEAFAVFQALTDAMRAEYPDLWVWQDWPPPYRDPTSEAVAAFRDAHQSRVRFYQYVQWVAGEQLARVADQTRSLGMPIGLYHDLALGSDRSGADAWVYQDILAQGADCGCPPDAFAPEGQNWGLPPVDPHRLRAGGYRMFAEILRHNLRFGGALRIDHVMALFRLFWIPRGLTASAGAYVRYPTEDLLGILALESVRHQALVVGEDLGTVPDEVRERLAAARVLSYRVFYFERRGDGGWNPPGDYPAQAVAVATTHDLPTLAGFWAGEDIEVRAALGHYPDEAAKRAAQEERQRDKARIWDALQAERLLPPGLPGAAADLPRMTPELCEAIHTYLAHTPSWVVLAALDDVVGEMAQANLPGTLDAYPNWSRRMALSLEDLRRDPRPRHLAAAMGALRPIP